MPPRNPLSRQLDRTYRERLTAIHAEVVRRLEREYGAFDPDAIEESFARILPRAAELVSAGQAAVQTLVRGYLRAYVTAETGRAFDPRSTPPAAGTNRDGVSLAEALGGIPPLVIAGIAAGRTVDEVREEGRYLVTRFADNELTAVADEEIAAQSEADEITGWEGIVSGGACDACQGNAGEHSLDEEVYRHPGCNCDRRLVVRAAA